MSVEKKICEVGEKGLIFPLGGDDEQRLNNAFRATLYAFLMAYFFLGVAIISEKFMESIDQVTSVRYQVTAGGLKRTHKVWNKSVATLTLMALGSSAPEIFLSMIDIVKKDYHYAPLGPCTIVGSAAFNLFVIIGVCIFVIPDSEVRLIQNLPAFHITAAFSVLAYVWMVIIVSLHTPRVIDLWEAALTFCLLPVLIVCTYYGDLGRFDAGFRRVGLLDKQDADDSPPEPVYIGFALNRLMVSGDARATEIEVVVERKGCSMLEAASCRFHTEGLSASQGLDFEGAEGKLDFAEGDKRATIKLCILARRIRVRCVSYLLVLDQIEGAGAFNPSADGGEAEAILSIEVDRHGQPTLLDYAYHWLGVDNFPMHLDAWREGITSAIYCNGSPEDQSTATRMDWLMHVLQMPFKVTVSLFPPVTICSGWPCFCASLCGIALLTACVADLADLFGCVAEIPDIVTAITLVALGTSMPDLFASLSAARDDPTAYASIVNVTGINSGNVFLGLGMPWTVAALYWSFNGRTAKWERLYPDVGRDIDGAAFVVETENLGFSVFALCWICLLTVLLLFLRRRRAGGELGGARHIKLASSICLIGFWLSWVFVVWWRALRFEDQSSTEVFFMIVCFVAVTTALVLAPVLMLRPGAGASQSSLPEIVEREAAGDTGGTGGMQTMAADVVETTHHSHVKHYVTTPSGNVLCEERLSDSNDPQIFIRQCPSHLNGQHSVGDNIAPNNDAKDEGDWLEQVACGQGEALQLRTLEADVGIICLNRGQEADKEVHAFEASSSFGEASMTSSARLSVPEEKSPDPVFKRACSSSVSPWSRPFDGTNSDHAMEHDLLTWV